MIGILMLLAMVATVAIAVRACEIATDHLVDRLIVAAAWLFIGVTAFVFLALQWAAYIQLPAGGRP